MSNPETTATTNAVSAAVAANSNSISTMQFELTENKSAVSTLSTSLNSKSATDATQTSQLDALQQTVLGLSTALVQQQTALNARLDQVQSTLDAKITQSKLQLQSQLGAEIASLAQYTDSKFESLEKGLSDSLVKLDNSINDRALVTVKGSVVASMIRLCPSFLPAMNPSIEDALAIDRALSYVEGSLVKITGIGASVPKPSEQGSDLLPSGEESVSLEGSRQSRSMDGYIGVFSKKHVRSGRFGVVSCVAPHSLDDFALILHSCRSEERVPANLPDVHFECALGGPALLWVEMKQEVKGGLYDDVFLVVAEADSPVANVQPMRYVKKSDSFAVLHRSDAAMAWYSVRSGSVTHHFVKSKVSLI